ncbi:Alcohol dehydrogenase class-3 like protein [Argiope bruennichi]|uniref:Alcohol dehydrogenase class-3 like protein n=1 Tax=Argiope bruennichi TaxID=94029 RepID=A0A8T0FE52_ARGBR|nr:Alcohol dehydrogenase class-3 like protein [Argiope bruennichi]
MSTGKPIVCKAAITWKAGKGFSIETVEVAVPKKGEVRVQVKSSGLCHTDVHMMEGVEKDWPFPSVLGHEGAGIVESIGEGVTDFAPGDIVVFLFEGYCGNCDYCKDSRTNMCRHQPRNQLQRDGTSRFSCKGKEISQLFSLGTFSEFTVVSVCNITKVNPKANPNTLCLVGCCIPTGYGAVINAGKVPAGATCAVWGLGGVGLCVLMGCRDSGASKIIGVDTNSDKFSVGRSFYVQPSLLGQDDYNRIGKDRRKNESWNLGAPLWKSAHRNLLRIVGILLWISLFANSLQGKTRHPGSGGKDLERADRTGEADLPPPASFPHQRRIRKDEVGRSNKMPPKKKEKDKKKKGEEEEVVGYDVKIMDISDLRQYAHMLEKDIDNMREYCTFFQKTEDKLVDVYRRRQEELKEREDSILEKNIELEKIAWMFSVKYKRNVRGLNINRN